MGLTQGWHMKQSRKPRLSLSAICRPSCAILSLIHTAQLFASPSTMHQLQCHASCAMPSKRFRQLQATQNQVEGALFLHGLSATVEPWSPAKVPQQQTLVKHAEGSQSSPYTRQRGPTE